MALNFNRGVRSNAVNAEERKPADRWINISAPTAGGGKRQLVGIPLSLDDPRQAKLIKLLDTKGIEEFTKVLTFVYRDGAPQPESDFDF